jgi:hypothetical protein
MNVQYSGGGKQRIAHIRSRRSESASACTVGKRKRTVQRIFQEYSRVAGGGIEGKRRIRRRRLRRRRTSFVSQNESTKEMQTVKTLIIK